MIKQKKTQIAFLFLPLASILLQLQETDAILYFFLKMTENHHIQ